MTIVTHALTLGASQRVAYIVDDAVDEAARAALYEGLVGLPFGFTDYDRPDTKHVRHLVHNFPRSGRHKFARALATLERMAKTLLRSRGHAVGERSRAYANFNLFGDYQFAHPDGDEWTALLFANDRWEDDWGGELLLYDEPTSASLAWAVPPRPGRLVVFDGLILHRGGVPSKHCLVPRVTVALKLKRPSTAPRKGAPKPSRSRG
jgi:hypothetical protein